MRKGLLFIFFLLISSFFLQNAYAKRNPTDLKKYTLQFNGKVTCKKPEGDIVGMFGAKIKLYVLREVSLNSNQPLVIDNLTGIGLDPKTLVADIKPDGSFNIDVEFSSNLQLVKNLFLEVHPGGDHGYVVSDEKQFIKNASKGIMYVYDKVIEGDPFRGIKFNFDQNKTSYIYNNLAIEVNPKIGVTSRYLKISHDFATWLAKDIKLWDKVNIPQIGVRLTNDFDSTAGGAFSPYLIKDPNIYIKPKFASYGLYISHEFGHYFHYLINSSHIKQVNKADGELIAGEGFAEFYNMLVENYATNLYGDLFSINFSEKLPYIDPGYSNTPYSGQYNNNIPRFATYLYNLYDGPTQIFIKPRHQGMDNDDIDGKKEGTYKKIFHIIKNMGKNEMYISEFHAKMKAAVPAEVAASIEKSHQFIFKDNKDGMPSAQVKEVKLTVLAGGTKHKLTLSSYAYTDKEIFYKNAPTGYRLYGKYNNNWTLIKTFPELKDEVKTYVLQTKLIETYKDFKITSYNASGESLHPLLFKNSYLTVDIAGGTNIFADPTYEWKASVSGGTAPYTYSWRMKKTDTEQYFPVEKTGPSNSFTTKAPQGKSFILQLWVVDKSGSTGYKELLIHTTIRPLGLTINGPGSITANEPTKWTAELEGGLPPYSYLWTKKVEGDFKEILAGQSNSCITKGDKNFILKLVIKDSQQKNVFITKSITINSFAPLTSSVSGDKIVYLHKEGTWQMDIAGGQPPYEVSWFKRKDGQVNYSLALFGQGLQCSKQLSEEGVFYLKALIKDAKGIFKESPEYKVTAIYQPMYAVIENSNVALDPGGKITWVATVAGGKPGYKYQWKAGKSLNALTLVSETASNEPVTSCLYQTKISDAGEMFIALSITDAFNKTVTVQQAFTVKQKPFVLNIPVPGEELNTSQDIFTYYPNPVQGSFTLSYKILQDAYVEVAVIDSRDNRETKLYSGQHIKGTYQKRFNTGLLKSGVYIIKLTQKNTRGRSSIVTDKMIIIK